MCDAIGTFLVEILSKDDMAKQLDSVSFFSSIYLISLLNDFISVNAAHCTGKR